MATVDDVLSALNDQISDAIEAAGVTNEGYVAPGWPNMTELTRQMEQVPAQYFVSIYPLPTERLTTRFLNEPQGYVSTTPATVTASIASNVLTFGGTVEAGLNIHTIVNGHDALYQTLANDALASIASGVAAAINALGVTGLSATAGGAQVTITGANAIACNVGGFAMVGTEVLRSERQFQISVWCPDAPTRSSIFNAIKLYLAQNVPFLAFPDTSQGRLKYVSSPWNDEMQQDTLYFLKAIYSVEWGEVALEKQMQIGAVQISTSTTLANGQSGPASTITEG